MDLNATQAAIRSGYSEKTAMEQGYQLLQKTSVIERISVLQKERSGRTQITADLILSELLKLATVDITRAFDAQGGLLPLHEIPEDVRKAIAGVEINELFQGTGDDKHVYGLAKKVKFWDKPRSLEMLGRHLGIFLDKLQVSGDKDNPVQPGVSELAAKLVAFLNAADRKKSELPRG